MRVAPFTSCGFPVQSRSRQCNQAPIFRTTRGKVSVSAQLLNGIDLPLRVPVCTDVKWVADVYHQEARIRIIDCFSGWSYSSHLYSFFGIMNARFSRPVIRPEVDLGPRSAAMTERPSGRWGSREDAGGGLPFEVFLGGLAIACWESISLPRRAPYLVLLLSSGPYKVVHAATAPRTIQIHPFHFWRRLGSGASPSVRSLRTSRNLSVCVCAHIRVSFTNCVRVERLHLAPFDSQLDGSPPRPPRAYAPS
ncbi:hypothetical protein BJV78DRAFT_880604 [Lactifluus subvellereus]|nr:hypothetical protein BJV78DRAFT_880604 [Lactifluus subvellereus]